MWYPSIVTVAPSEEPVTLAQAKAQLRIDQNVVIEDELLAGYISTAREHTEAYCNARWAEQTIETQCDSFADFERLPQGPLKSVISVAYLDPTGAEVMLDETVYEPRMSGVEPSIALKFGQKWPAIQTGSRIKLTAIYGGNAPKAVAHAILLFVGAWYENREEAAIGVSVATLPSSVATDALLCNHRRGV